MAFGPGLFAATPESQRTHGQRRKGLENNESRVILCRVFHSRLLSSGQGIGSTDGLHDRHGGTALSIPSMARRLNNLNILNFLTYGGAIRRGGPKPTVVHDHPERIAITLLAAWAAAGPRAETAYTAPPFFRPPQRRAAAFFYARKKKADTNCVANPDKEDGV